MDCVSSTNYAMSLKYYILDSQRSGICQTLGSGGWGKRKRSSICFQLIAVVVVLQIGGWKEKWEENDASPRGILLRERRTDHSPKISFLVQMNNKSLVSFERSMTTSFLAHARGLTSTKWLRNMLNLLNSGLSTVHICSRYYRAMHNGLMRYWPHNCRKRQNHWTPWASMLIDNFKWIMNILPNREFIDFARCTPNIHIK